MRSAEHFTCARSSCFPVTAVSKPLDAVICTLAHLPRLPKRSLLPLKISFALASWSLLLSTLTGVYMGYRCSWSPKLVSEALVAGTLVPVSVLLF